jgi:hypothetical protein
MKFDGSTIKVGDAVYDLVAGGGIVSLVQETEKRFAVKFGAKTFYYNPAGAGIHNKKTLYWRDPIGNYAPTKNDATWVLFTKMRDSIHGLLISEKS